MGQQNLNAMRADKFKLETRINQVFNLKVFGSEALLGTLRHETLIHLTWADIVDL